METATPNAIQTRFNRPLRRISLARGCHNGREHSAFQRENLKVTGAYADHLR
jgi:hypothetical protein